MGNGQSAGRQGVPGSSTHSGQPGAGGRGTSTRGVGELLQAQAFFFFLFVLSSPFLLRLHGVTNKLEINSALPMFRTFYTSSSWKGKKKRWHAFRRAAVCLY